MPNYNNLATDPVFPFKHESDEMLMLKLKYYKYVNVVITWKSNIS